MEHKFWIYLRRFALAAGLLLLVLVILLVALLLFTPALLLPVLRAGLTILGILVILGVVLAIL